MNMLDLIQERNVVVRPIFFRMIKKHNLGINDLLLLIHFDNSDIKSFDVNQIAEASGLSETEILSSFQQLLSKNWIQMETKKDEQGRHVELISLAPFYKQIVEEKQVEQKALEKIDIFTTFETEFARPISSMEYEIIQAWIEKGFKESTIVSALQEAVYNGVRSLRYIDKILYEWQKQGYKNAEEARSNFVQKKENSAPDLFDYNWLDDSDE